VDRAEDDEFRSSLRGGGERIDNLGRFAALTTRADAVGAIVDNDVHLTLEIMGAPVESDKLASTARRVAEAIES
jgi:hypothetical protein